MEFYGFDKQSLNLPGMRFGNFEEIGTAGLLGLAGIGAGSSIANNSIWSGAYKEMSQTNADMMRLMNQSNNQAAVTIAQQNASAAVDQTRWQVMGMIFAANTQYLQSQNQNLMIDAANRRASFTERKALSNELRGMVLQYNAFIHATDTESNRELTAMQFQHEERMRELERPVVMETTIDPSTLLS